MFRSAVVAGLLVLGEANTELTQRHDAVKTAAGQCSSWKDHGKFMDCGAGVKMCGVLVVENGEGTGAYQHDEPAVHGLWPQVKPFGSSPCVPPKVRTDPTKIYSCYGKTGGGQDHILWFENHEWNKHGACAGSQDAPDFFGQICDLAAAPLAVMAAARAAGTDIGGTADKLQGSGHCVWSTSAHEGQVMLSACASADGRWKLAAVEDFPRVCGAGPAPPGAKCVPDQKGPACKQDTDCANHEGCVRCAHSGYCTGEPAAIAFV